MNAPDTRAALAHAGATFERLARAINGVIAGQEQVVRHLLAAFLSGGHVLLEDYPGTGKTTLAKALARAVGAEFQRIQFTPDLLPTDVLGASVFDPRTQAFEIHRGPVFTNILLADEINRASPRTQSALLEAMAEGQVSLDGRQMPLARPFFVIATQNPVEFHGTYPLPEAQMDRFALRLGLGYVSLDEEVAIVTQGDLRRAESITAPVVSAEDVLAFQAATARVAITPELARYLVGLVAATRTHPALALGASPRASIALLKCAQALAIGDGLGFVTPDLVQELAGPVLCHRLTVRAEARFGGANAATCVAELLAATPVPR